ncbi:hypothetical protein CVIRNUC_002209 [Coccomyxa viridis]|uniref:ABC transporter domain-containing protein n=1 Tax=Coccomyxa viridis TaxID=1274662 RepID=A0AAV1HYD3_9CHLO|nr:hypothetical protein CVIRNUC_002209 [Coccomyxa viridis]
MASAWDVRLSDVLGTPSDIYRSLRPPVTHLQQHPARRRAHACTPRAASSTARVDEQAAAAALEAGSSSGIESVAIAMPPQAGNGVRVRVQDLSKVYTTRKGSFVAAENISLDIPAGKMTALLGPSGSGKTTLLRLIAGLEEPSDGSIFFDDEDATWVPTQEREIGFVFQSYALFKHMTCAQNIAFGPSVRKMKIDVNSRVRELLDLIELPHVGSRRPAQLSGGQRQRVALARALASQPRLLLLDEPFGALDPTIRASVRQGLKAIIDKVGVTSILVTHDQEEAFELADQVIIFNRGQVVQMGSPEELQSAPATPFVLHFIDDVNLMPANCQFVRRLGFKTEKPYVMCRPTVFDVSKAVPQPDEPRFAPATVSDRIDIGIMIKYMLKFDDGVVVEMHLKGVEHARPIAFDLQQRVYVRTDPQNLVAYYPDEIASTPL